MGSKILNVVSIYTLQIGLTEDIKKYFCKDLDLVIQDMPQSKKPFTERGFTGHIDVEADEYDTVHEGFGYRERNKGFLFWTLWLLMND